MLVGFPTSPSSCITQIINPGVSACTTTAVAPLGRPISAAAPPAPCSHLLTEPGLREAGLVLKAGWRAPSVLRSGQPPSGEAGGRRDMAAPCRGRVCDSRHRSHLRHRRVKRTAPCEAPEGIGTAGGPGQAARPHGSGQVSAGSPPGGPTAGGGTSARLPVCAAVGSECQWTAVGPGLHLVLGPGHTRPVAPVELGPRSAGEVEGARVLHVRIFETHQKPSSPKHARSPGLRRSHRQRTCPTSGHVTAQRAGAQGVRGGGGPAPGQGRPRGRAEVLAQEEVKQVAGRGDGIAVLGV